MRVYFAIFLTLLFLGSPAKAQYWSARTATTPTITIRHPYYANPYQYYRPAPDPYTDQYGRYVGPDVTVNNPSADFNPGGPSAQRGSGGGGGYYWGGGSAGGGECASANGRCLH
jgi:uncharacterized membrane protein YgcG